MDRAWKRAEPLLLLLEGGGRQGAGPRIADRRSPIVHKRATDRTTTIGVTRRLSLGGGAAAAVTAALAVAAFGGSGAACAQSGDTVAPRLACPGTQGATTVAPPVATTLAAPTCSTRRLLRTVSVRRSGRGIRVAFTRARSSRVTVSVFQSSTTRTVLGERLVFRRSGARSPVRWSGRRQRGRTAPRDGVFFVRVSARAGRTADTRRLALRRTNGRFAGERAFARTDGCGPIRAFKLERPAFGGRANRALSVSFRLAFEGRAVVELRRSGRTIRRLSNAVRRGGVLHRVRLPAERLRRGRYEVRLRLGSTVSSLFVRKV